MKRRKFIRFIQRCNAFLNPELVAWNESWEYGYQSAIRDAVAWLRQESEMYEQSRKEAAGISEQHERSNDYWSTVCSVQAGWIEKGKAKGASDESTT